MRPVGDEREDGIETTVGRISLGGHEEYAFFQDKREGGKLE